MPQMHRMLASLSTDMVLLSVTLGRTYADAQALHVGLTFSQWCTHPTQEVRGIKQAAESEASAQRQAADKAASGRAAAAEELAALKAAEAEARQAVKDAKTKGGWVAGPHTECHSHEKAEPDYGLVL
jgi:hypothetical protein